MSQDKADLERDLEYANRLIAALALKLARARRQMPTAEGYKEIAIKPSEMEESNQFDAIRFYNPQKGVLITLRIKKP